MKNEREGFHSFMRPFDNDMLILSGGQCSKMAALTTAIIRRINGGFAPRKKCLNHCVCEHHQSGHWDESVDRLMKSEEEEVAGTDENQKDEEAGKLGEEEEGCAPAGRRGDAATAGAVTYLRPGTTASNRKKKEATCHTPRPSAQPKNVFGPFQTNMQKVAESTKSSERAPHLLCKPLSMYLTKSVLNQVTT
jgi:hypothetical protein